MPISEVAFLLRAIRNKAYLALPRGRGLYPEGIGPGDLNQHAVLEASTLVVDAEVADCVIMGRALTDHDDLKGWLVDDATLGRFPAAGAFNDGMA